MEIKKIVTNDAKLLYVGTSDGEEYYQNTNEKEGWSFMGLRPETQENLRESAREIEPLDVIGISRGDFDFISRWFNYEQFADDMEADWYDRHDVQAERTNEEGETLYLGIGSGQALKGYLARYNITDYKSYCDHFDEIGLTEDEFTALVATFA